MQQKNFLSPIGFQFNLAEAPNMNYTVQAVSIPGLELGSIQSPTPFVKIPLPGNLSYDEFKVTFKVTETMDEYLEIFKWMTSLGHPDYLEQFKYKESDAILTILNSSKRPSIECKFTDAFPVALSPLEFDATIPDIQYVTVTASFRFLRFTYNIL